MHQILKERKLNDIASISFGENQHEVVSSMEIVMTLFQIDDDKEVLAACKAKLEEGIKKLKDIDQAGLAQQFKVD